MAMNNPPLNSDDFQQRLIAWQKQHGRHDLPWQQDPSPYRVLVSEIMLQQTQVKTVIPYFERWMQSFPNVQILAAATEDQVMSHWQGLGYYSRARNLRKAAIYIQSECQGKFPEDVNTLQQIPGVGRYTAGAIASFAYNRYGPIVDGNVKRLFCRLFGIEGVPGTSKVDRQLWQLAETYTPQQHNRAFAQGLLDMGATHCKPKKPLCEDCAFIDCCAAFLSQRVDQLPTAKPKKVIPTKPGHFLWVEEQGKILLERRGEGGIWGALWCLPQVHLDPVLIGAELKGNFKHTFTHYKLEAQVWSVDQINEPHLEQHWVSLSELEARGLPTPIKKFILKNM